ncbi:MAG: XrtA/PEP-CTERM system TPR-repeat protein PrsT [Pseudomonadota bacterium]
MTQSIKEKYPLIMNTGRHTKWPEAKCLSILAAVAITIMPMPCAAESAAEYLDTANEYYEKHEYDAAVIQLKNALLLDPDSGEGHLLLGKMHLEAGNLAEAGKMIERARELGLDRNEWLVPLARVYILLGRNDDVISLLSAEGGYPERVQADILQLLGHAYLGKQQYSVADAKFTSALELQPNLADALIGKARIAYQYKNKGSANEFIDRALAVEPENTVAWTLKGEILRGSARYEEAISAFDRAVADNPRNLTARLGQATVLIALGELDAAIANLDGLLKRHSQLSLAHYLKAVALSRQQKPGPALESAQLAVKYAPGYLPGQRLAGNLAYQQGELQQAEQYFRTYLAGEPGNRQTTRLLAVTLLKLGRPDEAVKVWLPDPPVTPQDAEYLSLLGNAFVTHGDAGRGLDYLQRAVIVDPESADIRTRLAVAQLASGDLEQGIGELQNAVEQDHDKVKADLLLIGTYFRNRDFDGALDAIGVLAQKLPDSPVPDNLKGRVLLAKNDRHAARAAFLSALQQQADFVPAHLHLAQIDLQAGDASAARVRYRQVLGYDENNLKAMLALAILADREGQYGVAEQWLQQAHDRHPQALQPVLLLVKHYSQAGEVDRALQRVGQLADRHPRNPTVLEWLARVQLQAGNDAAAIGALNTLTEVMPDSHLAFYQLAMVQIRDKRTAAARNSLEHALALQGDFPPAQLALGRLDIAGRDYAAVHTTAQGLQQAHPDTSHGYELEGDLAMARNEFTKAVAAYRQATDRNDSPQLVIKQYRALVKSGDGRSARTILSQWLAEHPDNRDIQILLAVDLNKAGLLESAKAEYHKILAQDPANVAALNNLAWIYAEAGDPAGLDYAERAYALVPDRPDVIDTLGWTHVQIGDTTRGLVLLQEAVVKASHSPGIRYHMAVALDKAGRRDEARSELDRLLKSHPSFPERDKAVLLRKRL